MYQSQVYVFLQLFKFTADRIQFCTNTASIHLSGVLAMR